MIVTCPACDTRYTVPDDRLGGSAGRRVRCANCGNFWRYTAEAAAIHAAIAETAANREPRVGTASFGPMAGPVTGAATGASGLVAERDPPAPLRVSVIDSPTPTPPTEPTVDATASAAAPLTRPSIVVEPAVAPSRRRRHVIEFVLVFIIAFVVLAALFARDRIAQLVPAVTPLLAKLNLTEAPTAGLSVAVSASRSGDALTIDGDIANSATVMRRIPRLRVTLRNSNKEDVTAKDIDAPVNQLPPGAKAHFTTVFDHPNAAATSVAASFITD